MKKRDKAYENQNQMNWLNICLFLYNAYKSVMPGSRGDTKGVGGGGVTKLSSQHSMLDHHLPAREMPF